MGLERTWLISGLFYLTDLGTIIFFSDITEGILLLLPINASDLTNYILVGFFFYFFFFSLTDLGVKFMVFSVRLVAAETTRA